ncbi:MAG: hypothetical protein JRJ85_23035, partial [Deltaproteobacteria bacterium]|nr:hypothetical protein [Deltaproteobacteria bacterium]
ALARFIRENVKTPHVYVSLDLDVGAMNCVHAARYMDTPGISKKALLDIAVIIGQQVQEGLFSLIGYDIMEFNMHFLGLSTATGIEDNTMDVVREFMTALESPKV